MSLVSVGCRSSCANALRGPHRQTVCKLDRPLFHMRLLLHKRLFRLVSVLRFLPRGLFGRSFLNATVPQPVPSWTPADRYVKSALGRDPPDTDKIFRSSCGTPRRSIIRITPGRVARSRGHIELARSRRDSLAESGESTLSRSQKCFSKVLAFMLHFFNLGGG